MRISMVLVLKVSKRERERERTWEQERNRGRERERKEVSESFKKGRKCQKCIFDEKWEMRL